MLTITIKGDEFYDEESGEFITVNDVDLQLEHSLFTLSKWESRHEKPFLSKDEKTAKEIYSYVEIMNQTPGIPPEVFLRLSEANLALINEYFNKKQTATWFREQKVPPNRTIVTSELIYYWMFSLSIPLETEHWHLNRLFTLIRVFQANNQSEKKKKMSPSELAARNRELNAQRRQALGTKG